MCPSHHLSTPVCHRWVSFLFSYLKLCAMTSFSPQNPRPSVTASLSLVLCNQCGALDLSKGQLCWMTALLLLQNTVIFGFATNLSNFRMHLVTRQVRSAECVRQKHISTLDVSVLDVVSQCTQKHPLQAV